MKKEKLEIATIKIERWGRYTFCEVKTLNGRVGIGIARRAFNDKMDDSMGEKIARGRAEEALRRKKIRKAITSPFMG